MDKQRTWTVFAGTERIVTADPIEAAKAGQRLVDARDERSILIFDVETGRQEELDLRAGVEALAARLEDGSATAEPVRGPGRPKLGVVGREVTLLPRHWEWLAAQPGGASVALRKLVEQARKAGAGQDRIRRAQDAAYRFMTALAGNLPGFEEASRALFAGDRERFEKTVAPWPADVAGFARTLAEAAFP